MPKKFVGPSFYGPWCLFLLIWQVSAPVCAQVQSQSSSVSAPKSILLLYSYGDGLPAYQQATRAFLSIMEEGIKEGVVSETSLFFEYLDLERKKDKEHYNNLTTLLLHKYATQKIDLIVTVHGPALKFLLNEGRDLSPGTPVLSYLGPDSIETTGIGRRFVLMPMSMDFRGTLQLAQKLFPQTMRVVFVNGIGEGEKRLEREAKSVFEQWPDKVEFEYTSDLSVEEMLQRVATLTAGTIVIYSNLFTDKTGRNFVAREVGGKVAKAANVPVFGMYNTLLGRGIIGGSVFNFEAEGARAGKLGLDILRGKLPLSKPTTILTASRTPMFDWQQLKRWEVNISRLPEGSIIVNRPPTVWGQYKEYVIVAIGVCLAQSLLITGLLLQRRRRRSAEASLARAEEKYRNIFEGALEGIYETSPQGQFLTANRALARMLGYDSPEEIISSIRDIADQVWADPNGRANYVRLLDRQNVVRGFECEFFHKDGTKLWVSLNTRRVTGPDGQTLVYSGFLEDITGRKAAEQALEERLKFEMMLADLSGRFINVPTDQLDAVIEDAQRLVCEHLGIDVCTLWQLSADQPGTLFLTHYHAPPDFLPPPEIMDARESVPWVLDRVLNGEDTILSRLTDAPAEAACDLEVWRHYGLKSFLTLPLSAGGSAAFGALNFNVIRDERVWPPDLVKRLKLVGQVFANALLRKRAEASLRQKTEELDQFFNLALDLLGIANKDGYFLRLNPAWERFLGYSREELMAKQFFDFVHPDDLERTRKAVSALVSEQKLIHFENRYRAKDGSYRWLEWTAAPAGNLIYAAARDLTERLKAEAEVRQRREELAHVTRVGMMGELTTSLAHEINQPLTAILSNAGAAQRFLSQATPDIGEVRQILDDIIRDDRRASEVVRRVRALVKKEKPRQEHLDLNELIQQVLDLIRGDSLLQGLSIRTEFSPGLATIHGDGIQLQQVILNLILNGAAAMRNTASGQRKIIVRTAMPDSRTVKAFVTDFGTGIDEHHIERLFEPFYTTKPEGLGMGLSISQTIIKAHGGTMEAWNNREGGATFAFTLPAHQGGPS